MAFRLLQFKSELNIIQYVLQCHVVYCIDYSIFDRAEKVFTPRPRVQANESTVSVKEGSFPLWTQSKVSPLYSLKNTFNSTNGRTQNDKHHWLEVKITKNFFDIIFIYRSQKKQYTIWFEKLVYYIYDSNILNTTFLYEIFFIQSTMLTFAKLSQAKPSKASASAEISLIFDSTHPSPTR